MQVLILWTVLLLAAVTAAVDHIGDRDNVEERNNVDNRDNVEERNNVEDWDKHIEQYDENNFTVAIGPNTKSQRLKSFCCVFAKKHCIIPCVGKKCTAKCTVRCGFAGMFTCSPISCQVANPILCTAFTTTTTTVTTTSTTTSTTTTAASDCDAGWTLFDSTCLKVEPGPVNYYDAIVGCATLGGTLATIESQAKQDAVYALTGSTGAYIGLSDFLDEGTFSWLDGTVVSFTNWRPNQPNNVNGNQHCVWIRPDGGWDDVTCKKTEQYVCQKAA